MSGFAPTHQLDVFRRFESGKRVLVGQLARNRQGVFFQYAADYLQSSANLSPFRLPFDATLHQAPRDIHGGLFGVFADSLPDGWGMRLMDRVFRQHGVVPSQVTGMDRLAYVGDRGMGALEYAPASPSGEATDSLNEEAAASSYAPTTDGEVALDVLGREAQSLFEDANDGVDGVSHALAGAASSGGARPKAQIWLGSDSAERVHLRPGPGLQPWLVKFTSTLLPLGHEESLCEAAYLTLAAQAEIDVPKWRLVAAPASSPAIAWLALERFDCIGERGRCHLHSVCGLLDADYRTPSLDYEDLLKASIALCRSPAVGQRQFARAAFNLFALNQDDHTKNWAFLQSDAGEWRPAPFYDVTFSPGPSGEHSTAFLGHGNSPPLAAMQRLGSEACFADWHRARETIERVVDALGNWHAVAKQLGVRNSTRTLIARQLEAVRLRNRHLLAAV